MKDQNIFVEITKFADKLKLLPDRELKKKRIKMMCDKWEHFLYKYTQSNEISGSIAVFCHFIYILSGVYFIWFVTLNKKVLIFIILIATMHQYTFLYFGGYGCILTRIERHLFNSDKWYGPLTIFKHFFDFDVNRTNIDNILLTIHLPTSAFFCYKVYKWLRI